MSTLSRWPLRRNVVPTLLACLVSVAGCAVPDRPVATGQAQGPGLVEPVGRVEMVGQVKPMVGRASALPPKYLAVKDFKQCLAQERWALTPPGACPPPGPSVARSPVGINCTR